MRYANTTAARAYAKTDGVDLNHIDARPLILTVLATLKRHPGQAIFRGDTVTITAADRIPLLERWIERRDAYGLWYTDSHTGGAGD